MRSILVLALAGPLGLAGCAYDTCAGTSCGDPCWVCNVLDPECGSEPPDGTCQDDGACSPGQAGCRTPPHG
ncbi:MAG TPA: hypothetical protein VFK90_10490 [Anaeromyxobacter sp.]|nr:hypothetical protein [Anaeromyxobacter sp.]